MEQVKPYAKADAILRKIDSGKIYNLKNDMTGWFIRPQGFGVYSLHRHGEMGIITKIGYDQARDLINLTI